MNFREPYIVFVKADNKPGSNKASSFIRALDLLGPILAKKGGEFSDCSNIWKVRSNERIAGLYEFILEQQRLGESGIFKNEKPVSYWRDGWCSAALKNYGHFLIIHQHELQLWDIYRNPKLAPDELSKRLTEEEIVSVEKLVDEKDIDFKSREGKEAVRAVKTRIGQDFFRKMILSQYQTQCCITGLNVPEVLRASHISGWAEDSENRMNPANGLCLSATYDAAFDKHLISFDDDYRMILSPLLREHYTNKAFKGYFLSREGTKLNLPNRCFPNLELLGKHRSLIGR